MSNSDTKALKFPRALKRKRWAFEGNTITIDTIDKYWRVGKSKRKIKSLPDPSTIVLHAPFQALVNFMEKELPGETTDWSATKEHAEAWKTITYLYQYWKKDRPRMERENKKVLMDWSKTFKTQYKDSVKGPKHKNGKPMCYEMVTLYKNKKEYNRLHKLLTKSEKEFQELEDKNLIKLCEIRSYLWT
jgi:hypothetical protein